MSVRRSDRFVLAPAHRGRPRAHRRVRRTFTAALLAVVSGAGFIAAAGPAHAASTWWVTPGGPSNNTCGTTQAGGCGSLAALLTRGTSPVLSGDTVNVVAGTYTDRPVFNANKAVTVNGVNGTPVYNGGATGVVFTINVGAANTVTLNNLTLTNGKATTATTGGALTVTTGKVVATGLTLSNSTASANGGGAYVGATAGNSLSMTGGAVSGNSAPNGGGIFTVGAPVSLDGTNVTGNTATGNGGGIDVSNATASLTMNNGTVGGSGTQKNAAANGGGIFTNGGAVNLSGTTVTGNSATTNGGGLYVLAGTATLTNTDFSSNTTPGGGGGIVSAGTVNANGGSWTSNAAANGGALFNNTGLVNLTGVAVTGNSSTSLGGAIYNTPASGRLNTSGGSLSSNTSVNGGAVYNGGVAVIDGTTVNSNVANGGTVTNGGNGGAFYNSLTLTVENATMSGNKVVLNTNATPGVTGYGGAIVSANLLANTSPTVTLDDTTISGGGITGGPASCAQCNATWGGAIAGLQNIFGNGTISKITGTNLTLSKNVAAAGGGIYTFGSLALTGSTLDQNSAVLYGAAVLDSTYNTSSATIDSTDVTDNTASVAASGLTFGAGVTAEVRNGSTISGNSSPGGSGIFNAGALAVKNSHVDGNTASSFGGGIVTVGPATLTDSTVDDNTATVYGGGLSTSTVKQGGIDVPAGSFAVTGGHVNGNTAGAGGGAYIGNGLVASFSGTDFKDNSATTANSGAGAIASAGRLTIDRATISGNTASPTNGIGGAIVSGSNDANVTTTLKLTNSLLTANSAFWGPVLVAGSADASSTNKTSISNTTIHANDATGPFGAVYVTDPTSIAGSTITDNTAVAGSGFDAYGALLAGAAGQISLSGSILSGNSGHQCNVAVADGGYNLSNPAASECGLNAGSDVVAAPQLGALSSNGGPTQTRLPGPTSPALDRITNPTAAAGVTDAISGAAISLCPGSDQRGTARPQGAKCDIGAVEADQVVPTVAGPATATYVVGSAGGPQHYTSTGSPQATLVATGLPSGLTYHDNGDGTLDISGTPAVGTGGSYAVKVKATNEAGTGTKDVTITVKEAATLSGPSSATYTVGQPGGPDVFHQTGGFPVATLSGTGTPPSGVGFTDNGDGSGQYAGTPATGTGGVYNLGVKASNGTPPDATVGFVLTVKEAPGLTGPSSATFKVGTAGASGLFTATGFPVPTLSATGLPTGLVMSATGSGTIHGTAANNTGGEYDAQVVASNGVGTPATKDVHLTVNEAPELSGPTSIRFVVGTANTASYTSTGYPQATVTKTGTLPGSLTFTPDANGGATIHGTAVTSEIGTYHVTIKAANGVSPDSTIDLTLEVVPPVAITTTSLPNAAYHTSYSANLGATGGQPPYSWSLVSGNLPPGLTLNANGMITGSASVSSGTYTFKVKVTDGSDPVETDTRQLSITVGKGATTLVVDPVVIQKSGLNIKVGIVSATLTGGFPPQGVAGQTINFYAGTTKVCTGVTDANGRVARCGMTLLNTLKVFNNKGVSATYAGNTFWLPSSGSAGLVG